MRRGAKAAIVLGAAVAGFIVGSWATALVSDGGECVSTPTTTTCTVVSTETWWWLAGGIPAAVLFAVVAWILVSRFPPRFADRDATQS